jgi:hypothetical protein
MTGLPSGLEKQRPERFVLGLDVGSSVIRCHVYDRTMRVRGSSEQKVTGKRALGEELGVAQHLGPGPPYPAWTRPPAAPTSPAP